VFGIIKFLLFCTWIWILSSLHLRHGAVTENVKFLVSFVLSVLWHCWLGGRKGIRPVKISGDGGGWHWLVRTEWLPAGWSMCLPLLISPCTIKSRSSLHAPAHPGGPRKRAVKWLWFLVSFLKKVHVNKVYRRPFMISLLSTGIVCTNARKSYLIILEPVANQTLRMSFKAYHTSPAWSVQPPWNFIENDCLFNRLSSTNKTVFQPLSSLCCIKTNASLGLRIPSSITVINIIKWPIANHHFTLGY